MIEVTYALRQIENQEFLHLDHGRNYEEDDFSGAFLSNDGENGLWSTESLCQALLVKERFITGYSVETPNVLMDAEKIEVVAIHTYKNIQAFSTNGVSQSIFDFATDDHFIKAIATSFFGITNEDKYQELKASRKNLREELNLPHAGYAFLFEEILKKDDVITQVEPDKELILAACREAISTLS